MEFLLGTLQRPWVLDLVPVREVGECFDAHVNTNIRLGGLWHLLDFGFTSQNDEPLVYIFQNLARLDLSCHWAAVPDLHVSNLGERDPAVVVGETEARLWIAEGLEALLVFEPREAHSFLGFESIKEPFERLVQTFQGGL
jgi:hypothetical protein